jgi:hypothetical protein
MQHSPSADLPQLELDFSPRPTTPPPEAPPTSAGAQPQQLDMLLASFVRVLDDVVGQAAGQAVTDALARLEQSHTRELAALAERFEAALERQEARSRELLERQDERLRELLERQDERLREVLACQARAHAEELRAALREVTSERSEHCEEIQETLRLGFGEVRSALDRNNHELTKLRAERAPPPIAASRPPEPAAPERAAPADTDPAPTPQPRAAPARSPPVREDRAASQRRFDALADDETTDHAIEDPPHRPLRYRPPDDDAEPSYTQEASP